MKKKFLFLIPAIVLLLGAGYFAFLRFSAPADPVGSSPALINKLSSKGMTFSDYEHLRAQFPDTRILWNVPVGNITYPSNAESLELADVTAIDVETLLPYFPDVRAIRFTGNLPDGGFLTQLRRERPELTLHWEVLLAGRSLPDDTRQLDLADVDLSGETDLIVKFYQLPALEFANLQNTNLSSETLNALVRKLPQVRFRFDTQLAGLTVSVDAERIDLSGHRIQNLPEFENQLRLFRYLTYLDMTDCGLSDEAMDLLNRAYPDIQIVWTVTIAGLPVRTDETTFMPVKYDIELKAWDLYPLRYCTEMVCIDIGHMERVKDCEWAVFMPNLQYLLMGKTSVSDLTPLSLSDKLVYLEIFSTPVRDYSPLLGCTALEDLNLGMTYGDPAPIKKMTWLKNLWWCDAPNQRYGIWDQMNDVIAALPDTDVRIWLDHPCADGWRRLPNYYAQRDLLDMYYID